VFKKIVLYLGILFFVGCAVKPNKIKSKSYLVTLKFADIRFSDVGFLNTGKNYTNLQVFSAGTPLIELKIQDDICIDYICMIKMDFNRDYLNPNYPDEIMQNILHGKAIFNSKNINKTDEGFTQNLKSENYEIIYEVTKDSIYFKDFINRVLIKLKVIKN